MRQFYKFGLNVFIFLQSILTKKLLYIFNFNSILIFLLHLHSTEFTHIKLLSNTFIFVINQGSRIEGVVYEEF